MRRILTTGLLLFATACAARSNSGSEFGPALTIERFLQAANSVAQLNEAQGQGAARMADEIETMARLFGDTDGSILERDDRDVVEQRMFLIAQILRHTDYELAGERTVPGRSREAVEVLVRITNAAGTVDVPFTVVQSGGEWLINVIDLEAITMQ
jgi:hypothetical protein